MGDAATAYAVLPPHLPRFDCREIPNHAP
jgi:hypothetical protein